MEQIIKYLEKSIQETERWLGRVVPGSMDEQKLKGELHAQKKILKYMTSVRVTGKGKG